MTEIRKRVLIIGAGAAGIAAATKLYQSGLTDVIVIEAENRIGGRVHSIVTPEGELLEMGAAFIHKKPENCVLDLAASHDKCVSSNVTFENMIYARSTGELVKKDMSEMMREVLRGLHKDFVINKKPTRKGLSHYVLKKFPKELKKEEYDHIPHEVKEEFIDNVHHFLHSHQTSDMLYDHEIHNLSGCTQPRTFTIWKDTGFITLFDLLLVPKKFVEKFCSLNTKVVHISKTDNEELRVECSNKVTYVVQHVICTVSVGVLQDSYERLFGNFLLPEEKIRAIRGITLGTIDKIFLQFSDTWWPKEDCNGFALLWSKQDRQEFKDKGLQWATGIFAITRVDSSPHTLVGWISGWAAKVMETVEEIEVRDTILALLKKFLGAHFVIPSETVKCYRSKWYTNEHFRGSYGFRNLQKEDEEIWSAQIAYPIYNKEYIPILLFAGEATDNNFYSTVHGAVESGWREANRLITLKKNDECDASENSC